MKVLIDTNIWNTLLLGDEEVARLLEKASIVYLSVIVIGELLTGFRGGSRERQNRTLLEKFIENGGKTLVFPVTMETSERFALIKDTLKKKGKPIPLNDIWIAAQCMETGSALLTRDAHFKEIEGLLVVHP